jgi:hypothetical protein
MLELKNIIEDIVMDEIEKLDESKDGTLDSNQKTELASYVLNRLKPMYITSNRGFSNIIIKYKNDPQFLADIMIKIDEGMKVVQKTYISGEVTRDFDFNSPYYILPKIYGKIISSRSLMPVEDAKVTLYIDGKITKGLYADWSNPLDIDKNDSGIFSFAPTPEMATPPYKPKTFQIKIVIEAGETTDEKFCTYECSPVFLQNIDMDFNENILQLEDIYIKV